VEEDEIPKINRSYTPILRNIAIALTTIQVNPANNALKSKDEKVIFQINSSLKRWDECIKELHDDESRENEIHEIDNEMAMTMNTWKYIINSRKITTIKLFS